MINKESGCFVRDLNCWMPLNNTDTLRTAMVLALEGFWLAFLISFFFVNNIGNKNHFLMHKTIFPFKLASNPRSYPINQNKQLAWNTYCFISTLLFSLMIKCKGLLKIEGNRK